MKINKNINIPFCIIIIFLLAACANIGRPDGGPFDELPPVMLKSSPKLNETNVNKKKISIEFDEYIKLENASEKVVLSPPQTKPPTLSTIGKKIVIELNDSVVPNTTYTIDFGDAIVDNNEGNALEQFTFAFSTGDIIDTMEVSGTVLNASDLEPKKGMLVGLYSNLSDTAFTKTKMERIGRTDSRGQFRIKGIKPGKYKIYALLDNDQNYMFSQKSEELAYLDSLIIPSSFADTRYDTTWIDTLTIDTIIESKYTHYIPDNIILKAFQEEYKIQSLLKTDRANKEKFTLFFNTKADSLPEIKGLNFNEENALIIEPSMNNDTIMYWIKDSTLYNIDTLRLAVTYITKDSLLADIRKTDTINAITRKLFVKKEKKKKKDEKDSVEVKHLKIETPCFSGVFDGYKDGYITVEHPLESFDRKSIRLQMKKDTILTEVPFNFEQDKRNIRQYNIIANWEESQNYVFTVDSGTVKSIYGITNKGIKAEFKIRPIKDYGMIVLHISGLDGQPAFAEILNTSDKPIRKVNVVNNTAEFNYIPAGKYYFRLCIDKNGDGEWTTGDYEKKIQPEEVFYYNGMIELKAMWTIDQDWNLRQVPANKQKPLDITKQKPEEKKKVNRTRTYQ